jgi:hypothetical protein
MTHKLLNQLYNPISAGNVSLYYSVTSESKQDTSINMQNILSMKFAGSHLLPNKLCAYCYNCNTAKVLLQLEVAEFHIIATGSA